MITRNEFHVGDKILLYHSHLKLFSGKLCSHRIWPFVVSNIFSYGAVEITSVETNKVLKINEHQLKTFYKGWTIEFTTSIELVEPINEAWTCDMSSQWYKIKVFTRSQPDLYKKISYLLFFFIIFYFPHFTLCLSFSLTPFFYFNIENNVVFKCGGGILIFFVVYMCFIRKTHKHLKKKTMFSNLKY
jgi:hypothetical protein